MFLVYFVLKLNISLLWKGATDKFDLPQQKTCDCYWLSHLLVSLLQRKQKSILFILSQIIMEVFIQSRCKPYVLWDYLQRSKQIPKCFLYLRRLSPFFPFFFCSCLIFSPYTTVSARCLLTHRLSLPRSGVSQWPHQSVTPPSKGDDVTVLENRTHTHTHTHTRRQKDRQTETSAALDSCLSIWPTLWAYLTFDLQHWSVCVCVWGGALEVNRDTQHFEQWQVYTDSRCNIWSRK